MATLLIVVIGTPVLLAALGAFLRAGDAWKAR